MIRATNTSPILRRLGVTRQTSTNKAQPSGKAPKLARMLITASGESSVMSEAAAAPNGSPIYLRPISERTISAASSTARLNHDAIRVFIGAAPAGAHLLREALESLRSFRACARRVA